MDIDIGYSILDIRFTFGCTADQRRDWDDRVHKCAIGSLWKSNMATENPQLNVGFIWFYMVLYHSKFNTDRENKPCLMESSNPYLPGSMLIYWRVYHSKIIYKWVIFHCHV